jgi:hypothetical protein
MKYRMLSQEELEIFETELKQFLVVNHVYDDEWKRINADEPEKAVELVGLFSDQILQTVYEKIECLEFRSTTNALLFRMGKEHIELIAIQAKNPTVEGVDLSTPEKMHEMLKNHAEKLAFFKHQKAYQQPRELEIHSLLNQGCVLSTLEFWETMKTALEV